MERLTGRRKHDAWGSVEAISDFLGESPDAQPFSELWFGGQPDCLTKTSTGESLASLVSSDPQGTLGTGIQCSFGPELPFLVKIIAPDKPLSLQVHPTKEIAREGYLREDILGIPREEDHRIYKDMNHKPEMVYALTDFEALVGFRVPCQVRELLSDLDGQLAQSLRSRLPLSTARGSLRSLVTWLFDQEPSLFGEVVEEFVAACTARLASGKSPSNRTDALMRDLAYAYPGDPAIVVAFLMNPVNLRAGEAVYIPPLQIHSYQSGLGVEVMAASDNVIRAGITHKYVDVSQLIEITDFSALPPMRIAPEHSTATTDSFLAPVQEFKLSVTTLVPEDGEFVYVPGEGPRIVLALEGIVSFRTSTNDEDDLFGGSDLRLSRGEAAFVAASERELFVSGQGKFVQCAVP